MPANPLNDPNWATGLADLIDTYVGKVRTTVTDRAVYAVRAVVFGIVIAIALPVTVAFLLIFCTRLVQSIVSIWTDHDSSIWISYMIIGGMLMIGGSVAMRKRFTIEEA